MSEKKASEYFSISQTDPNGNTATATYDADNNVLTRRTRRLDIIAFTYDTLNRVIQEAPPANTNTPTQTWSYDLDGRTISASSNGPAIAAPVPTSGVSQFSETMSYDQLNRLVSASWTPAASQTTPSAASVSFAHVYDGTNRIIGQTVTDNGWWSYPTTASSTSYSVNNLNQYTAVGAITPQYDQNGNLVSADKFDPMASATAGTLDTLSSPGGSDLLEYDGATGAIQRWYVHGAGLVNQVNVAAGTRETLIPDIQGSLIGMLDSGGTLARQGFQPFGVSGNATGPFAYTGQRLDAQTGLYNYMARMYSPALGRFLQPDPAGTGGSGNNLYAYVGNDPLDFDDPTGMCFLGCFWKSTIGKIAVAAAITVALQFYALPALETATGIGVDATAGVTEIPTGLSEAAFQATPAGVGLANAGIAGAAGGAFQGGNLQSAAVGAFTDVAFTGGGDIIAGKTAESVALSQGVLEGDEPMVGDQSALNFIGGAGTSRVVGGGVDASLGGAWNPGWFGDQSGAAGFGSAGYGYGLNLSGKGVYAGFELGSLNNVFGQSIGYNFSLGPFSASIINNSSGQFLGATLGWSGFDSPVPLGFSRMIEETGGCILGGACLP